MQRKPGPVDVADLRGHNLGLALRALRDHGALARTEIAAHTGLAHASVTNLMQDLAARGLVSDDARPTASDVPRHRGRPRALVRIVPTRVQALAVQVLADAVTLELVGLDSEVRWQARYPHDATHGDPGPVARIVADALREAATRVAQESGVLVRCVLAMAAPVDVSTGEIVVALDFGWANVDLVDLIHREPDVPDVPIRLVGDGLTAAVAESHALDPVPPVLLYVKADTGVGGGVVIGGDPFTGGSGFAGTIGHLSIDWHGRPCACGNLGCLVTYLGPEALIADAGLEDVAGASGKDAALLRLRQDAEHGRKQALDCLERAGEALGAAIQAGCDLLNPTTVVLGGYLPMLRPWLEPGMHTATTRRPPALRLTRAPVHDGRLAERSVLSGAAAIALESVLSDPSTIPAV